MRTRPLLDTFRLFGETCFAAEYTTGVSQAKQHPAHWAGRAKCARFARTASSDLVRRSHR